ncbi:hypothetical protein ACE1AT_14655 [Pelatocladus sp. BLCC-F211]|uniref:hypothetical protein n=1 Tax=Pelatocladus sp. BLCC-F211 TaxID=3342752 RepID=UPI0035BAAF94
MINRILDLIFIDSFAFVINTMFGKLLKSKICNYASDGQDKHCIEDEENTEQANDEGFAENFYF